jgi:hypothetical protein
MCGGERAFGAEPSAEAANVKKRAAFPHLQQFPAEFLVGHEIERH